MIFSDPPPLLASFDPDELEDRSDEALGDVEDVEPEGLEPPEADPPSDEAGP